MTEKRSHLALLIKRYLEDQAALRESAGHLSGDGCLERTVEAMIGTPVETAEDALAVVDWLQNEVGVTILDLRGDFLYERAGAWLMKSLRSYVGRL